MIKIIINKGKEANKVYINNINLDFNRSNWYPQPIIIKKIGIKDHSKKK